MQLTKPISRIPWIDIAKGYGTILVIYAHLSFGVIGSWMYSFHLPLFFFLSGYVFSTKDNFIKFMRKKVKSIVVPYFCLGIPMVMFELLRSYAQASFSAQTAIALFKELVFQQRFWTLWFIACLFCLNIAFYVLVKLCRKEWLILLISAVLPLLGLSYYQAGGAPLYWNMDTCAMAVPFFAVGYLYKLHAKQVDSVVDKKCWNIPLFIVFAIINVITWLLSLDETGTGLEMFYSKYGNPIFTYISAFAGIFCVVIISKWFTIKPIQYLGENSMLYYAWHQTIMIPIITKGLTVLGLDALRSYSAIGFMAYNWIALIGIVVVLTICNWGIGKLELKFMLGK